jgi:hypothetical protein
MGTRGGLSEHGSEPSGCIKCGVFFCLAKGLLASQERILLRGGGVS